MPNPTKQNVHIDSALTNISVAYIQDASAFVAAQVFPVVPVTKQSDRYFVYLKEDWFRDEAQERMPGTESAGGGYEIDNTPTYFCKPYAYHKDVTEDDRANSDDPLKPDEDATQFVTQKMLLKREVLWAATYFDTDIWTTEYVGAAATAGANRKYWSSDDSTPIQDVRTGKTAIMRVTGYEPNILVIGVDVFDALADHADILDRIKYGGTNGNPAMVTEQALAALFNVERVLVAKAVKNSAAKGATEDTDFILGKHALLCYAAPNPGIKQPSAGYIFSWTGLLGAGAYGNRMARIPMDWLGLGTERLEGEIAFDQKVIAADLGCFFYGIVE